MIFRAQNNRTTFKLKASNHSVHVCTSFQKMSPKAQRRTFSLLHRYKSRAGQMGNRELVLLLFQIRSFVHALQCLHANANRRIGGAMRPVIVHEVVLSARTIENGCRRWDFRRTPTQDGGKVLLGTHCRTFAVSQVATFIQVVLFVMLPKTMDLEKRKEENHEPPLSVVIPHCFKG